jgi:O-methyltransferase involved in polyketide biosynthesis
MSPSDQHVPAVSAMTNSLARAITTQESEVKPQPARVYDYYLNGATNFAVDRDFAKEQIARHEDLPLIARENRYWQARAAHFIRCTGVRQFIDFGSGLPAQQSVHEIVDSVPGTTRVIYVDNDPVVVARAFTILTEDKLYGQHHVIWGDVRQSDKIWQAAIDQEMFDPAEPVGLIASAVLHFVPDHIDNSIDRGNGGLLSPQQALAFLRDVAAPGSYLAISHATLDDVRPDERDSITAIAEDYTKRSTAQVQLRSRVEISRFFGDWPVLAPGLAWTAQWRPGELGGRNLEPWIEDPARYRILAGVAHKRELTSATAAVEGSAGDSATPRAS